MISVKSICELYIETYKQSTPLSIGMRNHVNAFICLEVT